jgi:hypothetical protein
MKKNERFDMVRKIRLELSDIKPSKFQPLEKDENDPCYEDYVQLGTKIVDGKEVPNCVPLEASKVVKEGFPIPSPEGGESESDYMSRCISEISGEYEQSQSIAICIGKWQGE